MSQRPVTPTSGPCDLTGRPEAVSPTRISSGWRANSGPKTIWSVSQTGGHFGAGLGVVEMTVAIHAVFDTPRDKLIWDVSHQCYPHKILTGRRDRMLTIRQKDGLSGFTKRSESPYDPFGAAHASTSISAALGFALARELGGDCPTGHGDAIRGDRRRRVVGRHGLRGDETNAGHLGTRLIVILNDNEMSIAPPTGGYVLLPLAALRAGAPFQELKAAAKGAVSLLPEPFQEGARRAKELLKAATGGRDALRGTGVQLYRPHRRPRHGTASGRPAHRQGARRRADPDPRDHEEGQGLRRAPARPRPRHREIRRGDRRAEEKRPPTRRATPRSSPAP